MVFQQCNLLFDQPQGLFSKEGDIVSRIDPWSAHVSLSRHEISRYTSRGRTSDEIGVLSVGTGELFLAFA